MGAGSKNGNVGAMWLFRVEVYDNNLTPHSKNLKVENLNNLAPKTSIWFYLATKVHFYQLYVLCLNHVHKKC